MGFTYTPDQQKVITLRDRNILVSAAAGSGKTAVLVERIVRMVCDPGDPVDIDKLLIVTFTNAAAAEMRERIRLALSERLEQEPDNGHLQRQTALLHNAQITTIDSFCMFIIRNHFNDIGLDPGFRIADEGELKLLQAEVLDEMLEGHYQAQDEAFFHCLECFSPGGSEKPLKEHILRLYDFSMSHPWPEEWMREKCSTYVPKDLEAMDRADWAVYACREAGYLLADCAEALKEALEICGESDGPYMYGELLESELERLKGIPCDQGFMRLYEAVSEIAFGRLPSRKDPAVSAGKRELVKRMRGEVKDIVTAIRERYFFLSPQGALRDIAGSRAAVEKLVLLTLEFTSGFGEKKREKNILDFNDIEHFALEILLQKEGEGYAPSQTALDYRKNFREILIDEYQDSNLVQEYLLKSISGEDEGKNNRFMVGDVKQSIYRFRLARPEIFMEKLAAYSKEDGPSQRIDLHRNFRSRRQVVESVNYIFRQIMGSSLGGLEYDGEAALYPGASYPEQEGCRTELLLLRKEGESGLTAREQEAVMIASKIRELMQSFQVTDRDTGELRRLCYRDIVILLRSNAGWDEPLRRVFSQYGIPAYATSRTGYFSSMEIRTLMNVLRVIDNPLQDIPLFGVLHAPFVGMTEDETALVRASAPHKKLYHALLSYTEEEGADPALTEKIGKFRTFLEEFREKSCCEPVRRLIRDILSRTGYLRYVSALPEGEKRRANVEMLLEKAADFEKTSYFGLFHFIRYVEQLEKYDVDFGEANTLDENADIVRIMTVHKSKGLEFPVCFVAGLSKRFNIQDTAKPLLMDVDLGIGCEYADPQIRIRRNTVRRNTIARKLQMDSLGEELRILYVALTRAKEKLFLTACVDKLERAVEKNLPFLRRKQEKISYTALSSAGSYLDLILAAWIRHESFVPVLEEAGAGEGLRETAGMKGPDMHVQVMTLDELAGADMKQELLEGVRESILLGEAEHRSDKKLLELFRHRFSRRYPFEELAALYTKTTVSELKSRRMTEEDEGAVKLFDVKESAPYIPSFRRKEQELPGAVRGSAYHKVMELLRLERFREGMPAEEREGEIRAQLRDFRENDILLPEYAACVSPEKISRFLESSLAARMREAGGKGKLFREQPFVLGVPADEVDGRFPPTETVLIQGIIDVYFEEEDGLVVADYKTDSVKDGEELVRRYHSQLAYYARALEQLTGRPVKEKIIYSFCLGAEIFLEDKDGFGENPVKAIKK